MNILLQDVIDKYMYMNSLDLWELMKSKAILMSKEYCRNKSVESKIYRCNLYKNLEYLQDEVNKVEYVDPGPRKGYKQSKSRHR